MNGWMRYPGRLAHNVTVSQSLLDARHEQRIGTEWRSHCSRSFRIFWAPRPWPAIWVDPIDLRLEEPRGWCLKCAYWAALEALILPERSYEAFRDLVQMGRYQLVQVAA